MYDIQKFYIRSDAMTVTNQKFNLNAAYKTLKILWDIWDGPGSGWRVDKIDIYYLLYKIFTLIYLIMKH